MIQANVRQDLLSLVPSSVLNDIKCFVFYDNHPQGDRVVDVLVCTQHKEIIEYYKREQISSILLNTCQNFCEVRTFRNTYCELFYIVATEDELYILSTKEKLILEHRLTEVESYEIFDPIATGRASLKVMCKDDAVPLYFDDNFMSVGETCFNNEPEQSDNSFPIVMQLTRKLTEVKFSVKCSEKKYNEVLKLRQVATFYFYQNMCPNLNESLFNINSKEIASSMDLETWTPWVKICNKKLIIAFNLFNKNNVALEHVYILLNSSKKSIVYMTKLLEKVHPHWSERKDQKIKPNTKVTIVTSIDVKELQNNVKSKIEFDMVLAFKKCGKDYLLPFEKIIISVSDVMKEDFDVLANPHEDEQHTFLAVLSTCEKVELCLRHIQEKGESCMTATDLFCKYLKMEAFTTIKKVVIHRTSPYHILHGVMVIFRNGESNNNGKFTVEVHSRCPSQILALIHSINDVVPFRIIVTTPNYKITANVEELSRYNEELPFMNNQGVNYAEYGTSALKQTSMLLQYLNSCVMKMNESKNQAILSKVGCEIDIFACGLEKFREFRNNLLNEIYTAIEKCLKNKNSIMVLEDSPVMNIDDD